MQLEAEKLYSASKKATSVRLGRYCLLQKMALFFKGLHMRHLDNLFCPSNSGEGCGRLSVSREAGATAVMTSGPVCHCCLQAALTFCLLWPCPDRSRNCLLFHSSGFDRGFTQLRHPAFRRYNKTFSYWI